MLTALNLSVIWCYTNLFIVFVKKNVLKKKNFLKKSLVKYVKYVLSENMMSQVSLKFCHKIGKQRKFLSFKYGYISQRSLDWHTKVSGELFSALSNHLPIRLQI